MSNTSSSLGENAITLMNYTGSITVNLAAAADTETVLWANVTGETFIPVMVILRNFSGNANATPPIVTLGLGSSSCDQFLGATTLSAAAITSGIIILQPVPSATPASISGVASGYNFSIEITQANGAALTCFADVFGYLISGL